MDCRATPALNFKAKLGFSQHDPTMTQEQSMLSKNVTVFAAKIIILQHNVLGYTIDAYFPKYKLPIEVDEQGQNDRDIDYEIERQKSMKKNLVVNLLGLVQLKKILMFFVEIGIENYIVKSTKKLTEESTKKSIIDDVKNLLKAASKFSNNGTISKFTKNFARHLLPTI